MTSVSVIMGFFSSLKQKKKEEEEKNVALSPVCVVDSCSEVRHCIKTMLEGHLS